jgi:O-antigen/teichoic acid export membrane protein
MKVNGRTADTSQSPNSPGMADDVLRMEFRRNLGQISRHSAVFFVGTLFTMAAGYLAKIYVARVLGSELLGLYALGMTLVSLTQLVGVMGLPATAARYVAVYSGTGKINELRGFLTRGVALIVGLNLALSIGLAFGGSWIAQKFYHAPNLGQYMPLLAILVLLGSLNVFYCQILAGFKDISMRTVITNFIGSPLVAVLTVLLLALGMGMWGYLVAQIVNSLVVVVLLVVAAWKLTPAAARFSFSALPPLDPEVRSFAVAGFGMAALDFLVSQADKILLGLYLNPRVVGIYVLASTLSALIPMVLQSVNQIFAPIIGDLHAKGRQDVLQKLFQTLTKWILASTLPLAFVVIIFAPQLMRIFGADFEVGWPVLVIGAIGQLVNCGVGSVGYLLLMSGNQRRLIRVQLVMAGVSVLMNISLIPVLGMVGAALAAALINVVSNLWNLSQVRRSLQITPYNRGYFALLVPTAVMVAGLTTLRMCTSAMAHQWVVIVFSLLLSYALFGVLAIAYALDPDDRMIARSAWLQFRGGLRKLGAEAL